MALRLADYQRTSGGWLLLSQRDTRAERVCVCVRGRCVSVVACMAWRLPIAALVWIYCFWLPDTLDWPRSGGCISRRSRASGGEGEGLLCAMVSVCLSVRLPVSPSACLSVFAGELFAEIDGLGGSSQKARRM